MMMQAADVRDWDDRAAGWRLGNPRDGRIFVQREVSAPLVVVNEVALQVAAQGAFVPHDDVIEAFAPEGADHAFNERILPRRTRRRSHFLDAHLLGSTSRIRSIDPITIPDHEARRGVPRPRLAELLRGPCGGRMGRNVHVDDAASVVRQHDEHEQHTERGRLDREEVDRGELGDVIGEERAPRLSRRTTATPEVLRHGGLRHVDAEFLQLAVDAGRSPEWVRLTHSANQDPEVRCQRRPTDAARSRVPSPICGERAAMPTHDRGRRHDLHRLPPVRPDDREQHPEQPIERTEARSFRGGPLQYSDLMPKRENLRRELEPRADRDSKRGQQGDEQRTSSCPRTVSVSGPQPQRPQHVPNIQ